MRAYTLVCALVVLLGCTAVSVSLSSSAAAHRQFGLVRLTAPPNTQSRSLIRGTVTPRPLQETATTGGPAPAPEAGGLYDFSGWQTIHDVPDPQPSGVESFAGASELELTNPQDFFAGRRRLQETAGAAGGPAPAPKAGGLYDFSGWQTIHDVPDPQPSGVESFAGASELELTNPQDFFAGRRRLQQQQKQVRQAAPRGTAQEKWQARASRNSSSAAPASVDRLAAGHPRARRPTRLLPKRREKHAPWSLSMPCSCA
jgi:hypothetical protein